MVQPSKRKRLSAHESLAIEPKQVPTLFRAEEQLQEALKEEQEVELSQRRPSAARNREEE